MVPVVADPGLPSNWDSRSLVVVLSTPYASIKRNVDDPETTLLRVF